MQAMKQTNTAYPKITVIRPRGSVNISNVDDFQRQITTAIAQKGNSTILVDMEQVETLDSAGLMVLVSSLKLAQSLERRLIFCCVSPSIRMIFELTQLDKVVEVFERKDVSELLIQH